MKPSRDASKIYNDDRNLPYKTTMIKALDSKRDIDGLLAHFGIHKVMWDWNLEQDKVSLTFELSGEFKDSKTTPVIRLKPPTIWKPPKRNGLAIIDWKISMRILHWYIKNALAWTYANQSSRVVAFLPDIVINEKSSLKDVVLNRFEEITALKALPGRKLEKDQVIDV